MADKKYDVVIFGASGYTGKYVVENLYKILEKEGSKLTWAIAGRSKQKLEKVLEECTEYIGKSLKHIPVMEADVSNLQSIDTMCKQAKVILNCVGPYRYYGEPVIKSCIENRCHHLDLSGETQFLEGIQLKYHQKAQDAGVYIIGAAGLETVPYELGIQFVQKNFKGDINSVETFFKFINDDSEGGCLNTGTLMSIVHLIAHFWELLSLTKKIFPNPPPKSAHQIKSRKMPIFYEDDVKGWGIRLPLMDRQINRTTYYNYHNRNMRPVQVYTYLSYSTFCGALKMFLSSIVIGLLAPLSFTRKLIEKYPSIVSLGMFKKDGPTRRQVETTTFELSLVAEGYPTKLSNIHEQHSDLPSKKIIATVKGPEAAYMATSIFLILSGLAIIEEPNKLPKGGGVFTVGSALHDTSLLDQVQKYGVEFSINQI